MHRPETWGYVQFSTAKVGTATFQPDPAGPARHLLHRIYYAQRDYRKKHGRWASKLEDLDVQRLEHESLVGPPLLEVTQTGFEATVDVKRSLDRPQRWHIRQDSRIWSSDS